MRLSVLPIIIAVLALTLVGAVSAQPVNQHAYAYLRGDIWKFDLANDVATQLTHSGFNGGPILSPDGGKLAFLSTADAFITQWEAATATQTGGTPPADIWVMDVAAEAFTRIADQSGASAAGFLRSAPAWSPDSQRLAWIQLDPQLQSITAATLQIHDFDTGLRTAFGHALDLGSQGSEIDLPVLRWGNGGIARLLTNTGVGDLSETQVQIIDVAGGTLSQFNLNLSASGGNALRDFVWVNHLGNSQLALQIQDYWEILNPADGSRARLLDPPRLKNRGISGAIQVIPASVANANGDWDIHWYATSGANLFNTGYDSPRINRNYLPGISPDGTRMAWHNGDHISSWNIGLAEGSRALASDASHRRSFPIPEPVSVVWAPTEWITTGAVAGAPAGPLSVACALTPLLSAGNVAIVKPDVTLRIRGDATASGAELAQLEAGSVLNIEAGPICADGYHWYAVHDEVVAGWSAEGGVDYWLLYHVACADSPATRLTTGMTGTATADSIVNIRSGAGSSGTEIVWAVAAGDEFEVTGLPQCGDNGLRWYPVTIDEYSGWIAEGQADAYWIEPVTD